jgi:hypothetical protein
MGTTGAPWNIPFADPSDLVRGWPDLSEDVGEAVAAGLDKSIIALGPNVVQTVNSSTFSQSLATGAFTSNLLTTTITPSSNTSKILLLVTVHGENARTANAELGFRLRRGSTSIGVGGADGSRPQVTSAFTVPGDDASLVSMSAMFLDSPGVATAVSYHVQLINLDTTTRVVYLNRTTNDTNSVAGPRPVSSLTAIEVAA